MSDCCGYSSLSPCYSSVGNSAYLFILESCDYILMHICMDFINPAKSCGMLFHCKSFWFCFLFFSSNKASLKMLPWHSVHSFLMIKILLGTYWNLSVLLLYLSQIPFICFIFSLFVEFWVQSLTLILLGVAMGRHYFIWIFLKAMLFVSTFSIFYFVYSCFTFAYMCFYNFLFSSMNSFSFVILFMLNICSLN